MKRRHALKIILSTTIIGCLFPLQTMAATAKDDFSYHTNNTRAIKKGTIKNKMIQKKKKLEKKTPVSTHPSKPLPLSFSNTQDVSPALPVLIEEVPIDTTDEDIQEEAVDPAVSEEVSEESEPLEETTPFIQPQNPKLSQYINPFDTERHTASVIIDNNCQQKYGCDPYLVMGVLKRESNVQVWRVNKSGAAGIAQFLPATARGYGLFVPEYKDGECQQNNLPDETGVFTKSTVERVACDTQNDERFHLEKSIKAMIQKVLNLIHQNDGNERMALANYNGGWWPSFFKDAFSKDTDPCIDEIIAQSEEIFPDTFLLVKQGSQTIHGGMNPFSAPNDKIVTRGNIEQVCSYVNSITAYKESFLVGQWP